MKEIDEIMDDSSNRSVFIEDAVREYIERKKRELRDQRDLELINKSAQELNKEAEEMLSFQVEI